MCVCEPMAREFGVERCRQALVRAGSSLCCLGVRQTCTFDIPVGLSLYRSLTSRRLNLR